MYLIPDSCTALSMMYRFSACSLSLLMINPWIQSAASEDGRRDA